MRNLSLLLLVPLAAACTSMAPADPNVAPPAECSSTLLQSYVGQPGTAAFGAKMLRETGRTVMRWVPPGTMVTMDFRADRLTVELDSANTIKRVSCS